jgi:hypothetical protein
MTLVLLVRTILVTVVPVISVVGCLAVTLMSGPVSRVLVIGVHFLFLLMPGAWSNERSKNG